MSRSVRSYEVDAPTDRVLRDVEVQLSEGDVRLAMAMLRDLTARAGGDSAVLKAARDLRHRAYGLTNFGPPPDKTISSSLNSRISEPGVPEIASSDLDAAVISDAFGQRGCLLVRGLLSADTAAELLELTKRAIAARDNFGAQASTDNDSAYVPFEASDGYSFGPVERVISQGVGGMLTVESPAALAAVVDAFYSVGLDEVVGSYLCERPVLSAKKSSLRRADSSSPTEWHQDGAFLGADTPSINVWVALTDCGVDAPSIDVVPHAFDHVVKTGGDDALFDWSVGASAVRAESPADIVRPVFKPGDALLFNQLTLHRSGLEPTMSKARYAIESWFFGPSAYPHEQIPILF